MGDRGNVFFADEKVDDRTYAGVYMYTHWSGRDLPGIVQSALKRGKNRWDDPQYLSRIIFCEVIKDDVEGLTGVGLSSWIGDNGYAIVRINPYQQRVEFVPEGSEKKIPDSRDAFSWSFEEYVAASLDDLNSAHRERS